MARVLVVEDDTLVRKGVNRILERIGHEVWESASAKTALKLLTVMAVDVIITDVYMPGMNGMELLAHLSGRRANQHVIVMTGGGTVRAATELLTDALRIGAEATLEKPFSPGELTAAVSGVLAASAA